MAVADYLPAGIRMIPELFSTGINEADFAAKMTVYNKEMTEEHVLVYASLIGSCVVRYRVRTMFAGRIAGSDDAGSQVAAIFHEPVNDL